MTSSSLRAWIPALVALVALLGVVCTLSYEFVYDDQEQVVHNPWIRSWSKVGQFFTTDVWAFHGGRSVSNYYRPLQMLIYTAAYSIAGLQPWIYHFFNILLHAFCAALVTLIGFRLTGKRFLSAAGGLLFALHPIHAESVAWIAGVTDPLCAVFCFAALYFYLRDSPDRKDRQALFLAMSFYLCALFSKEMAFTFPLVAAWSDWCLHRRLRWSRYGIFAAVFAFYAFMRAGALHALLVGNQIFYLPLGQRIWSSIVLVAEYTIKMFVPYGMSAFHVFMPTTSILTPNFALSLIWLAVFITAAWFWRRRRVLLFLFGFCFLTIAPALNLTGIGENVFADRYLYIPTLGSCLLVPLIAGEVGESWRSRLRWLNLKTGAVFLGIVLAVFAWRLWHELAVWRDPSTLFQETMRRSPGAASFAHLLAGYYFDHDDINLAEQWDTAAQAAWEKSFIKSKFCLAEIYSGFGGIRFKQGQMDQAGEYFKKAYDLTPDDRMAQNLAVYYVATRDYEKALHYFEVEIRTNPTAVLAYSNIAGIYATYGRYDQAIAYAQKALEIEPDYSDACLNLARAYAAKGMKEEALRTYLNLKKIDPSRASIADAEMKSLR